MTNNAPWDITDDEELKSAVRDETQYTEKQLPTDNSDGPDLNGLVDSAKRVLALKAGVTSFYNDRGVSVALLGVTCAKAKGAVENSPVQVKNVAGDDVTFRVSDGGSLQLAEYEEMTRLGLSESQTADDGPTSLGMTRTFLSDSSSR